MSRRDWMADQPSRLRRSSPCQTSESRRRLLHRYPRHHSSKPSWCTQQSRRKASQQLDWGQSHNQHCPPNIICSRYCWSQNLSVTVKPIFPKLADQIMLFRNSKTKSCLIYLFHPKLRFSVDLIFHLQMSSVQWLAKNKWKSKLKWNGCSNETACASKHSLSLFVRILQQRKSYQWCTTNRKKQFAIGFEVTTTLGNSNVQPEPMNGNSPRHNEIGYVNTITGIRLHILMNHAMNSSRNTGLPNQNLLLGGYS